MSARRSKTAIIASQKAAGGLRGRINANCVDCTYDNLAPGNWKQQVQACTIKSCSFWDIRPRSKSKSLLTAKEHSTHPLGQDESDSSPVTAKCLHTDERIVCHES